MSYIYNPKTLKALGKFRAPCIESDTELDREELKAYGGEIAEFTTFLKKNHITWCKGLILKGSGGTGDIVEPWRVVNAPYKVTVMLWLDTGEGLNALLFGTPLIMGGRGYAGAEPEPEPRPGYKAVPVVSAPETPAEGTPAEGTPVEPEKKPEPEPGRVRKPNPPQARVIEKRSNTKFTGLPKTGIPSLDRARRGGKR